MEVVFDENAPVSSKIQRTASLPLEQVKDKSVTINVLDREKYDDDALFTIAAEDLDARGGSFLHEVTVNADRDRLDGETILPYVPPSRDGHRYSFRLYLQPFAIDVDGDKDRRSFDVEGIVRDVGLRLIGEIIINVPLANKGRGRAASLSPPPRQVPSVMAGARSRYSTAASSPRSNVPARSLPAYTSPSLRPASRYSNLPASRYPEMSNDRGRASSCATGACTSPRRSNLSAMSLNELLSKADREGVRVRDRTSRNSAIASLERSM